MYKDSIMFKNRTKTIVLNKVSKLFDNINKIFSNIKYDNNENNHE